MDNDNTTKSNPIEGSTLEKSVIFTDTYRVKIELTNFTNKSYVRLRVLFPNGSYENVYISKNRFEKK